jgi:hypothetical protein
VSVLICLLVRCRLRHTDSGSSSGSEADGEKVYSYSALDEIETVLKELTEISEHTHAPGFQLTLRNVQPADFPDSLEDSIDDL